MKYSLKEYSFTEEEKEFIKNMNFGFEVNKSMTEEQLFIVLDRIDDFVRMEGIGPDDWENELGKLGADILTKIAHEDEKDNRNYD